MDTPGRRPRKEYPDPLIGPDASATRRLTRSQRAESLYSLNVQSRVRSSPRHRLFAPVLPAASSSPTRTRTRSTRSSSPVKTRRPAKRTRMSSAGPNVVTQTITVPLRGLSEDEADEAQASFSSAAAPGTPKRKRRRTLRSATPIPDKTQITESPEPTPENVQTTVHAGRANQLASVQSPFRVSRRARDQSRRMAKTADELAAIAEEANVSAPASNAVPEEPPLHDSQDDSDDNSDEDADEVDEEAASEAGSEYASSDRGTSTTARGEDFSMIGLESFQQGSFHLSHGPLPEMGERTSRIVDMSLQVVRQGQGHQGTGSPGNAGEVSFQDLVAESSPSSSSVRSAQSQSAVTTISPRKKATPLAKILARKTAAEAAPGPWPSTEGDGQVQTQDDNAEYDDSFSQIPAAVLDAAAAAAPAAPAASSSRASLRPQAELEGDLATQPPAIVLTASAAPGAATPSSPLAASNTVNSVQSSPARAQDVTPGRATSRDLAESGSSHLRAPSETARPSLSPIVRAGRVLQSVTSSPPTPQDTLLRSPFRGVGADVADDVLVEAQLRHEITPAAAHTLPVPTAKPEEELEPEPEPEPVPSARATRYVTNSSPPPASSWRAWAMSTDASLHGRDAVPRLRRSGSPPAAARPAARPAARRPLPPSSPLFASVVTPTPAARPVPRALPQNERALLQNELRAEGHPEGSEDGRASDRASDEGQDSDDEPLPLPPRRTPLLPRQTLATARHIARSGFVGRRAELFAGPMSPALARRAKSSSAAASNLRALREAEGHRRLTLLGEEARQHETPAPASQPVSPKSDDLSRNAVGPAATLNQTPSQPQPVRAGGLDSVSVSTGRSWRSMVRDHSVLRKATSFVAKLASIVPTMTPSQQSEPAEVPVQAVDLGDDEVQEPVADTRHSSPVSSSDFGSEAIQSLINDVSLEGHDVTADVSRLAYPAVEPRREPRREPEASGVADGQAEVGQEGEVEAEELDTSVLEQAPSRGDVSMMDVEETEETGELGDAMDLDSVPRREVESHRVSPDETAGGDSDENTEASEPDLFLNEAMRPVNGAVQGPVHGVNGAVGRWAGQRAPAAAPTRRAELPQAQPGRALAGFFSSPAALPQEILPTTESAVLRNQQARTRAIQARAPSRGTAIAGSLEENVSAKLSSPPRRPLPSPTAVPLKSNLKRADKERVPGRAIVATERASTRNTNNTNKARQFADHFGLQVRPDDSSQLDDFAMSSRFSTPAEHLVHGHTPTAPGIRHMYTESDAVESPASLAAGTAPKAEWGMTEWVVLNDVLHKFRQTTSPSPSAGRSDSADVRARRSTHLVGKVVHGHGEALLIKGWHIDVADAFRSRTGSVWSVEAIMQRLFALLVAEHYRGELVPSSPRVER